MHLKVTATGGTGNAPGGVSNQHGDVCTWSLGNQEIRIRMMSQEPRFPGLGVCALGFSVDAALFCFRQFPRNP